jgi:hypothetical protein
VSKRQPTQKEKFEQAAREAEADMSEADFKKVVGKLAKAPKPKSKPKAKGSKDND